MPQPSPSITWSWKTTSPPLVPAGTTAVHTRYGPPEVVRIKDVPRPIVGENDLLVRVRGTTVNRTDCAYRAAKPFFVRSFTGLTKPRVKVLGNEFAGEVAEVGSAVGSFKVGDRVFGYNEGFFGAHADFMAVPDNGAVATMPANSTFEEAAAATEGSHYALGFIRKANIRSGQDVLVNGATGAIGSAAVQLVNRLGARVTAVCATEYASLVEGLGAARVIDYTAEDFTKDDQTYDAVLDTVGKSTFGRCKPLLKPRGVYISSELGPMSQNPILALLTPVLGDKKVAFPIPRHDQQMARHLKGLIESGEFRPVIDRKYPLEQIAEAYRYVETGQKIGNVVIDLET